MEKKRKMCQTVKVDSKPSSLKVSFNHFKSHVPVNKGNNLFSML